MATERTVALALAPYVEGQSILTFGERPTISPTGDGATITFARDLTAQEQVALDALIAALRATVHPTAADYDALRPQLQILRDLRQMGRNAFMAQTAAERDRLLYDAQTATTIILLAILRA